jgi:uncharacterized delta-60 repeat protein
MKPIRICAMLLPASLAASVALGAPAGELDPAFGDHGRVLLREAPFYEFAGVDVFVDPASGRLTVVADGYGSDRLLRFNSDGSLDPGFGDRGTALLGFGEDDLNVADVHWLTGGELLIAGAMNVYGTPDYVLHGTALLARLHADGSPDLSFGNGGRATIEFGGEYESVSNILLQPDGKIVVLGFTDRGGNSDRILARFTANGSVDSSFGDMATPGFSVIDVAGIDARFGTIVRQADGKFLVCGDATMGAGLPDRARIVAIRINADGRPDTTFGNNGMALIGGWQDSVGINTCLELADGHLVFAGSFGSGPYGSDERQRAAVWRITPDGRLDAGFGTNGIVVLDTDTPSSLTAMTAMTDGAIAIAGLQWKRSAEWQADNNAWLWWSDMLVTRIDPTNGAIDRAFGNRGATVVDLGVGKFSSNAYSAEIIQQPDGKLVVIGAQVDWYDWYPWNSIAMARVDPYGSGSNGWASMIESNMRSPASGGDIVLHLRRTGGGTGQLSVDYRTVAGTATAGEDYVETSGTVVWQDSDLSDKAIAITVLDSGSRTSNEVLTVELFNSSGGLGMDYSSVYIPSSETGVGEPPVPAKPGDVDRSNHHGAGAIGIDLWFLSLLVLAFRGPGLLSSKEVGARLERG